MRKFLIAGNWKMNLNTESSIALVKQLIDQTEASPTVDVVVCPAFVHLSTIKTQLSQSCIGLGAQNMSHLDDGAMTGEVSGNMLKDVGCQYVILGHSERRQLMGETDNMVNQKLLAAFKHGLTPIVCVGETLEQRESGQTNSVVSTQCRGSLAGLSPETMQRVVIAYEPVWAIGTGKTATPAQAEEVHAGIRKLLGDMFGGGTAERVQIQYGGSVKADNALQLLGQPNIDGALVGGASLKAEQFIPIVQAAKQCV